MENTLLIGLSRQMALQREMDVVANNVANLNTNGFKANTSIFEEYLMPVARANNFPAGDNRLSFVQDRGTLLDLSQGAVQLTGNALDVAIDGDAFLSVQTPRGERYTRNGASPDDVPRGKLKLVRFAQPQRLIKDGSSYFSAPAGAQPGVPEKVKLVQGAIEKSNVRSVVEMTRMIEVNRTYAAVAGLMQSQGDLRRNAIQQLAEVPSA